MCEDNLLPIKFKTYDQFEDVHQFYDVEFKEKFGPIEAGWRYPLVELLAESATLLVYLDPESEPSYTIKVKLTPA